MQPDPRERSAVPVLQSKVRPVAPQGLRRGRLDRTMEGVWDHRLTLVSGPAGSGKSTLLTQFVTAAEAPTAWYGAEGEDASVRALLAHLHSAFTVVSADVEGPWETVEDAALALDRCLSGPTVLAIDDLHTLSSSPAEAALERLLHHAPRCLHVVAGSRRAPNWNLSRWRVSQELLELSADELRFRVWEVEALFSDFWNEPLAPADVAQLARDVQGWAAGLQLFHLATKDMSAGERRRALARLPAGSRLIREYLARNVVAELPSELASFLLDTCVLGHLSGPLCDGLLGRSNSLAFLDELERRQMFVARLGGDGEYRYHEVLRSHLEAALVQSVGESQVRDRFRAAGHLMRGEGFSGDALHAFCRAEAWEDVDQLLKENGAELADVADSWLDVVPPWLLDGDPWVMLGTARRYTAAGNWSAASAMYGRAVQAACEPVQKEICERERAVLDGWLHRDGPRPPDWTGMVRAAVDGDPLSGLDADGDRAIGGLGAGLANLLAGRCGEAAELLGEVADDPDSTSDAVAGALLGLVLIDVVSVVGSGCPTSMLERSAEVSDSPYLTLIARSATALQGSEQDMLRARALARDLGRQGDDWGSVTAELFAAIGAVWSGDAPVSELQRLADRLATMRVGTLEVWCRSLLAVAIARSGGEMARAVAMDAERRAEELGVPGARAIAMSVVAAYGSSAQYRSLAVAIAEDCQLALPEIVAPAPSVPDPALVGEMAVGSTPTVEVRCLGGFQLVRDGGSVDLRDVRPRARSVLRMLAAQAGESVQVETFIGALWPDVAEPAARRNLQVAISTLRRVLEAPGESANVGIRREENAYCLVLPDDAFADVVVFTQALLEARAQVQVDDGAAVSRLLSQALAAYGGDLLPEEGHADWVVERRQSLAVKAAEAAHCLAQVRLRIGDPSGAAMACKQGLEIDRYHDGLWRGLAESHEAMGDLAAARRNRDDYDLMLRDLGVRDERLR